MKSFFFAITAIITFSMAFVSCQREVDWSINNPTAADSSYLIRANVLIRPWLPELIPCSG